MCGGATIVIFLTLKCTGRISVMHAGPDACALPSSWLYLYLRSVPFVDMVTLCAKSSERGVFVSRGALYESEAVIIIHCTCSHIHAPLHLFGHAWF